MQLEAAQKAPALQMKETKGSCQAETQITGSGMKAGGRHCGTVADVADAVGGATIQRQGQPPVGVKSWATASFLA